MPYLSLRQLAERNGIKYKTLRGWVGKGILRHSAATVGGQPRYTETDFEDARLRSLGQKDVVTPRPITVRSGGDVAALCRKLKKELLGIKQKQRRRKRAA